MSRLFVRMSARPLPVRLSSGACSPGRYSTASDDTSECLSDPNGDIQNHTGSAGMAMTRDHDKGLLTIRQAPHPQILPNFTSRILRLECEHNFDQKTFAQNPLNHLATGPVTRKPIAFHEAIVFSKPRSNRAPTKGPARPVQERLSQRAPGRRESLQRRRSPPSVAS